MWWKHSPWGGAGFPLCVLQQAPYHRPLCHIKHSSSCVYAWACDQLVEDTLCFLLVSILSFMSVKGITERMVSYSRIRWCEAEWESAGVQRAWKHSNRYIWGPQSSQERAILIGGGGEFCFHIHCEGCKNVYSVNVSEENFYAEGPREEEWMSHNSICALLEWHIKSAKLWKDVWAEPTIVTHTVLPRRAALALFSQKTLKAWRKQALPLLVLLCNIWSHPNIQSSINHFGSQEIVLLFRIITIV